MNKTEIKGRAATAIAYAAIIEDDAIEQIRRMCDYHITAGSRIRIMPDVHSGAGCTVGTTMTVTDRVVPNVVGVDIGCGMYTVRLNEKDIDLEKLDEVCHFIPSGMNVWEGRREKFDLTALRCYRELRDTRRLERSLGSLGGGNHFIEADEGSDGSKYLVIHSGSRNLGLQVARHYQSLAVDLDMGKESFFREMDELIARYKAEGRRTEIEAALRQMQKDFSAQARTLPDDLCCVYGQYLEDYLHDVQLCQQFASRNRELMAEIIMDRAGLSAAESFHTIHNYIDVNEMILRKGAIAAHKGEIMLIPINMRDGSILARGKGNPEWNFSAPHGAGRLMSRTAAKQRLNLEEYREQMKGIYTTSVNESTLDEAPMAYKSMEDIISVIGDTAEIIDIIRPVYNFKAN